MFYFSWLILLILVTNIVTVQTITKIRLFGGNMIIRKIIIQSKSGLKIALSSKLNHFSYIFKKSCCLNWFITSFIQIQLEV